jgi:hypothetical protein
MRLLTANDIEDEDDDENEHDRRIEEGRDQSFDAASGRRFEYRATSLQQRDPRLRRLLLKFSRASARWGASLHSEVRPFASCF